VLINVIQVVTAVGNSFGSVKTRMGRNVTEISVAVGGLDMTCPGEDAYGGKDTY